MHAWEQYYKVQLKVACDYIYKGDQINKLCPNMQPRLNSVLNTLFPQLISYD